MAEHCRPGPVEESPTQVDLDDVFGAPHGASFLYVALLDGEESPLVKSAAFGEFQSGIKARCGRGTAAKTKVLPSQAALLRE